MKKTISYLMLVVMVFFIIGCNDKSIEPRTVTFYSDSTNPDQKKLYDKAKELFEKNHPGVTVNFQYLSGTTFTTAAYKKGIDDLIQEGNPPDIVTGGPSFFTNLDKQEYLADINVLVKRNNLNLEDYFERPLLSNLSHNQKQLAIPTSVTPMVVFYNKSVFMNAGLPAPTKEWTWNDLINATQKIQQQSEQKITTVFPITSLTTLPLSNGGSILSPDGSTYKGYLDGKPSVEAISWYASKVKEGLFNNPSSSSVQDIINQLQIGTVGMLVSNYSLTTFIKPEHKDKIGLAILPSFPNKPRAGFATSGGLAILQKSKNPDLTLEFIKFIAMDKNEISEEFFQTYGMGMSKKITQSKEEDPYYKVKLESMPYIKKDLHQLNANFLDAQMKFFNSLQQIVRGGTDFQKELSDLAQVMDDELKKSEQK
jgi:multiple sugar transport system substrate-binding protein